MIKKVNFEYETFKKNLKYYGEFREIVIEILKEYNPKLADSHIAVVIATSSNANNLHGIGNATPQLKPELKGIGF